MATKELLLEIGLGQRLCAESVPTWEELQDVGTPSVNCFSMEISARRRLFEDCRTIEKHHRLRISEHISETTVLRHAKLSTTNASIASSFTTTTTMGSTSATEPAPSLSVPIYCCRNTDPETPIDFKDLTLDIAPPSCSANSSQLVLKSYLHFIGLSGQKPTDHQRRGEHDNPDVYNDLLLPTQWSVTDQGTAATFIRIRHPRKHTLHWFFANEDASLQVYTEDVEVELEVDTKCRLDGAGAFVRGPGDGAYEGSGNKVLLLRRAGFASGPRRMLCEKEDKDSAKFLAFRPGERGVDRLKNLLRFVGEHGSWRVRWPVTRKAESPPLWADPRIPTEWECAIKLTANLDSCTIALCGSVPRRTRLDGNGPMRGARDTCKSRMERFPHPSKVV
ncbi:hypothetical protein BKA70DRAFT_1401100 [Coprinopsis sp. MPI-PUGE-AT-0042]|nr:hypothetical protein BKA70DRAFT_1401100 [Coprinopsis sp. MPI-PUGE-AT-0042]